MTEGLPEPNIPASAEQLAEELVERYLDQLQAGEAPDRATLLAAHPEIADVLERHLRRAVSDS